MEFFFKYKSCSQSPVRVQDLQRGANTHQPLTLSSPLMQLFYTGEPQNCALSAHVEEMLTIVFNIRNS